MKLETFGDVLAAMKNNPNREFSLLLGNGFSVAYDRNIFSYNALHDFVSGMNDEDLLTILNVIETRNFELIMQHLDHFSALIGAFGGDPALRNRVDAASNRLKTSLLAAVKSMHPEHVFKLPEPQSVACANFLKTFLDTHGAIYSTNYDLLLYWVLMRNSVVEHKDGFGRDLLNSSDDFLPRDEQVWSDLYWGKHREDQNVYYLHGALPLFDSGTSVVKEEYDLYNFLLEKIGARMERGEYPIFVAAGNGQQKLMHIRHNQYLTYCYDRLCKAEGSLVTYGFSFGESDDHIIDAINKAAKQGRKVADRLWSIYIGVYSDDDKKHIKEIESKFRCKVHIFDAKTAQVWNQ